MGEFNEYRVIVSRDEGTGQIVAEIPALPLTEGCPTYEPEGIESEEVQALRHMDLSPRAAARTS